jgi:hypothetical protein
MGVVVRPATVSDIDWILSQLKSFANFYNTKTSLFGDPEYAKEFITVLVMKHLFLVADDSSHGLIGLIAGSVDPHPYNPKILSLSECFWWVDEKHRGSKAGLLLLNEFMRIGKEHCDWIWMTLESESPVKDATLVRRGFKEQERSFLLEV